MTVSVARKYDNLNLGTLAQLLHIICPLNNTGRRRNTAQLKSLAKPLRNLTHIDSGFSCEREIQMFCNQCQIKTLLF